MWIRALSTCTQISTKCTGGFRQLDPRTVDEGSVHVHSFICTRYRTLRQYQMRDVPDDTSKNIRRRSGAPFGDKCATRSIRSAVLCGLGRCPLLWIRVLSTCAQMNKIKGARCTLRIRALSAIVDEGSVHVHSFILRFTQITSENFRFFSLLTGKGCLDFDDALHMPSATPKPELANR